MNDDQIERALRSGPTIKTPNGLLEKLQRDIRVPGAEMGYHEFKPSPSWFKRWMPALSFAIILLGCLMAIGVQNTALSDLRQKNEELRAANQNLETLRNENTEFQRLNRQNAELEGLRKDNGELKKLRDELTRLAADVKQMDSLKADNQQLQAQISAKISAATGVDSDALAKAKARAERIQCANHMKQIGLAFRIWAGDNNDQLPTDFISMTNEFGNGASWVILQCPSDHSRVVASWNDVASGNVSYLFLTPGIKQNEDPATVTVECPIHHNFGLLDGSVQQLSDQGMRDHLKIFNGRKVFNP